MPANLRRRPVRLSKLAVAACAVAGIVLAASLVAVAADAYHERHMAMEAVGDAMRPLAAIAKKEAPFDAAVVKTNATTIAENLEKASGHFPAGSGGGQSRAKAEIWSDAAGFEKSMKDAVAAATALQSVKDEAAYGAAFGAVGSSCKSCHDKYRLPRQ
jgi:adenylosuccinate lyase